MKTKITCLILSAVLFSTLAGCASPKGDTAMDKRTYVQDMRSEALSELYRFEPGARSEITKAAGYAVFEAVQSQFLITSSGNAYGIVRDNQTNRDIYMSALSAGGGFGMGIKGFRAVVVFKNRAVMQEFVNKGWVFGASGTADAKMGSEGASASSGISFDDRMKIYTFTDSGVMAGASLRGVKVWKNDELN